MATIDKRDKYKDYIKGMVEERRSGQLNYVTPTAADTAAYESKTKSMDATYSSPNVDDNYINTFLSDYKNYFRSAGVDFQKMDYGTASSMYEARKSAAKDLNRRCQAISKYLDRNKSRYSAEDYQSLKNYLSKVGPSLNRIETDFHNQNRYFAQFDTEADYKLAVRQDGYRQKYQGKGYDEIQSLLGAMESGEEKDWLTAYGKSSEVLTSDVYERLIGEKTTELEQLEKWKYNYDATWRDPNDPVDAEYKTKSDRIQTLQTELEELQAGKWRLDNETKYGSLSENDDYRKLSRDVNAEPTVGFGIQFGDHWIGSGDPIYDYINDIDGTREKIRYSGSGQPDGDAALSRYSLMTQDEIANYNYLYNTDGKAAANEYLEYLQYDLDARRQGEIKDNHAAFATEHPALASLYSVPANLLSGVGLLDVAWQNAVKNYQEDINGEYAGPINYYRGAMTPGTTSNAIRGTISDNLADRYGAVNLDAERHPYLSRVFNGKNLGDAYQLGMSMLDSGAVAALSPLVGTAGVTLLGGSAGTQGALEAVSNGASDEQALTMGILNATFEILFEKCELENLLGADTTSLRTIANQALTEGFGEGFTSIANAAADTLVMADQSQLYQMIDAYMEQGLSKKEAARQALLDTGIQVGWDFFGGALMGAASGSGAVTSNKLGLNAAQNEENPDNTLAKKMDTRVHNGKNVSGRQVTALIRQNEKAMEQQDFSAIQAASEERLTELGETGDIPLIASALAKQVSDGQLSKGERKAISDSQYGQRMANELDADNIRSGGYSSAWAEQIGTENVNADVYGRAARTSEDAQDSTETTGEQIDVSVQNEAQTVAGKRTELETASEKYGAQAKAMIRTYTAGQDVAKYDQAYQVAYDMGKSGVSLDYVMNSGAVGYLSEGQRELAYEAGVAAAKSDRITVSDTGKTAQVKEVAEIRNGEMMLLLDNGETVNSKNVEYASDSQALIYDSVLKLGMDATAANTVIRAYNDGSGISAEVFAGGVEQAYTYGKYNYDQRELAEKGSPAYNLTAAQRSEIYKLGQAASGRQVAREQATVRKNRKVDKDAARTGTVHYSADAAKAIEAGVKDTQHAGVQAAEIVSKLTGVDVYIFESYERDGLRYFVDENGVEQEAANGWYNRADGSIHIDLHAGNLDVNGNTRGTVLFTLSHELTHFIKQWSPAKFKSLANFLMQEYGKKNVSVDALVHKKMDRLKLDYEAAFEEVVADSMETMLASGNAIETLAKLKQQDRTLWQKIVDFLKDFAAKLRNIVDAYAGVSADTVEGSMVAEITDAIYEIEQLYAEALADAGANYQNSLIPGENGVAYAANGDLVADCTEDGSVRLSMRTYEEEGRTAFRNYLAKTKLTAEEQQEMLDGVEEIYQVCAEFKDKYAPFSAWSDAAVVRDTYGKPVFSVVTPNGDYKMNLDFSLVCKKRRTLDAVFNEMSRRGIIDDFELGQKSVVKINEIIRRHGLETACALCFVDAKRFRQASMADQFTNLYNELVLSLVPEDQRSNIDHFNFGGYATIKKVEGGIDTWSNSELDFSHLDEVMKNYGKGTVEHKAAKYIKAHPEGRKLLLRGDFMSSQGFDAVKTQNKDILKLYNSKKGTGGPKAAFGDVQYMNEIIKKARTWTPAKAYAVGGVRIQSFSDYVPRMVFDYTQMIYDLAATKLPAHAYTKEALFVKQFGLTGVKINMSLIPAIAEGGIAPGLDANGDYVWAGESFDYDTAKEIQNAEGYTENCGTICVGVSHDHIVKLLRDPNIRMVIPYHKSGLNPVVAHMNKIAEFTDYTNDQRTKGEDGKALKKDFDFSKAMHDMGDQASPKAVADQYLKWCIANGYTAKFAEFAAEDNYYKLLEDFTLYDKDGNYVPQREVRAVFPKADSAFGSMKNLIQEGLEEDAVVEGKRDKSLASIVDEIQKTLPKTEAEIAETQVEQADRDLESDIRYSTREYAKQVDEVKNNTHDPNNHVYMGTTPAGIANVLDLPKLPMLITSQHIYSMAVSERQAKAENRFRSRSNYHNLGWDTVKRLPEYINNPVMIIKSNADKNDATFVVVTAQNDNTGNPIIAAVKPNGKGKYFDIELPTNIMLSGYGKDNLQRYVSKAKMENRILYVGKKISQKTRNIPSVQFADNILSSDYTANLAEFKKIVKQQFAGTIFENSGLPKYSIRDFDVNRQERSDDSVSNRSLLANALAGAAQNEIEQRRVQEYQDKIGLMDAEEQKLNDLNRQIRELSFGKGARDNEKLKVLRLEAQQTTNRINTYDRQLLRLEASKPLQNVLQREKKKAYQRAEKKGKEALAAYRAKAAETQREIIERNKESRRRGVESRERTAMRHKIQNVVGDLNDLLLNESKQRHIPDNLKKAVAAALDMVNMDTVGADERVAKYADLIAKETDPDKIAAYQMTMENIQSQGEKMGQRLKELRDAYAEIAESSDPDIANAHDPVIEGNLKELSASIGDTSLRDMSIEQLEDVYSMYKMVLTRVRNANKSMLDEKREAISELASKVVDEVRKVGGEHTYRAAILDPARTFTWNNQKPIYAMERIGSETMTDAFMELISGEGMYATDIAHATEFSNKQKKSHKYDSWDFKKKYRFQSASGLEFDLTLDQILSLYAYSKRDQAAEHLRLGGFVFDSNIETYKEKDGKKRGSILKYRVNTADSHQITPDIMAEIIGTLSADQRGFVDAMQDYLSTTMGAKGNEVTMRMYGVKLFKEKFYFPLKSAKQFLFEQNEVAGEVRIKNSGFTNKVVAKANNPVILSNFMDVWANHVHDMSMYHSFVLPLEDFNRIFNYNSPKQEGLPPVSVKGTIQNAYSPAAVNYVKQLITDLNGGARSDPRESTAKALMGRFKKAAVFASNSVVIQQPSALLRAQALVNPKYFGINPKLISMSKLWNEAKQYAPVAIIKEMGRFDTDTSRSTVDYIKGDKTVAGKVDDILSLGPAVADEWAWVQIWHAVKRETAAKHKDLNVGSKEFLQAAGKRFTEVIVKTQVYDSTLSRSANMRSKGALMGMATAFMAEPTTSINMLENGIRAWKRGFKKTALRNFYGVYSSLLVNAVLVSIVYAMRDDDEDETFLEKLAGSITTELLDGVNPLTYYPWLKDGWSLFQGFDVERSDMSILNDVFDAANALGTLAFTNTDAMDAEELAEHQQSVTDSAWTMVDSVASLLGAPVKNIRRDINSYINTYRTLTSGTQDNWDSILREVVESAKSAIPVLSWTEDGGKTDKLYDALISGDETHLNRLKNGYADDNAYHSAVRKALKKNDDRIREAAIAWNANDLDAYMRLAKETMADGFTQDDVVAAITSLADELQPDDGESTTSKAKGLFTAEKFVAAVAQGDQAMAKSIKTDLIQTAQKNGKTAEEAEKSFSSSAKSSMKKLFLDGDISESEAVNALVAYCGVEQEDAEKYVGEWSFEYDYGFSYDEREDAYKDGLVSAAEMRDVLINVGGNTEQEADELIDALDWMKANPQYDVYASQVVSYRTPLEDLGISIEDTGMTIDVFIEERAVVNKFEGDKYENGESIPYSRINKAYPYINSLNLTPQQKTALAVACGWKLSTVQRNKLW